MDNIFYNKLAEKSLKDEVFTKNECLEILDTDKTELLPLLQAAFIVREKHWARDITIHILNNVQNGLCSEDCYYCVQSKSSQAEIAVYPMKTDDEILAEAKQAYENGAFRYCMVFSGKSPAKDRIQKLVELIIKIKSLYPIQVCVSPGNIDEEDAYTLKKAGLDRLNHNINTAESNYPNICSSHTFQERLETLSAAQKADLEICSGVIIGMGEKSDEIISMGYKLKELKASSIPVNFLIPIPGIKLAKPTNLTPEYCLRVLCLFRFLNPESEIRIAAGREYHLKSLESLALYPANSLFLNGYLNTNGNETLKTLEMIKDAGFKIRSDKELDQLIVKLKKELSDQTKDNCFQIKNFNDLHPTKK